MSLNPAMIDIIVKILVEILSVLALATKQIKQGLFSKSSVSYKIPKVWTWHREIREEAIGRERDRGCAAENGPPHSR
jgi:hypothetical protein